jgi:hypothetical protein
MDCLATEGNEDFSWDAGKQSHYHRFWMVEMKILMPLSLFHKKQTWD